MGDGILEPPHIDPPEMVEVQNEIRRVCDEVADLLVRKNKEYGNSALEPMRVFSRADAIEQIKVRIDDKLSRIATTGEKGEIKEDTEMDLMGYLVLLRVAKRMGK
tara:strand:+ start:560 stop:874 length:315 start_codon:yes stop_codon:yes gene_type:complete